MKHLILTACAVALLAGCSPKPEAAKPAAETAAAAPGAMPFVNTAPAGTYIIDMDHSSVNFRISHMGLSHFTSRFIGINSSLNFDPAKPEAMTVEAALNTTSIQTNYPDAKTLNFDAQLAGKEFLDAGAFPQITFKSTKVETTGEHSAKVTGDLTLHGVTKPVVLDVTFNGGMAPNAMDPKGARIGFSGHTSFKRSDFGLTMGLPAPGSNMGVGDQIDVAIEAEYTKK
jgi:polyisoprenoid-binding protein YceI